MANVAPHMGAWIEIKIGSYDLNCDLVAPHMGAWIEIGQQVMCLGTVSSHPTWVRGLK